MVEEVDLERLRADLIGAAEATEEAYKQLSAASKAREYAILPLRPQWMKELRSATRSLKDREESPSIEQVLHRANWISLIYPRAGQWLMANVDDKRVPEVSQFKDVLTAQRAEIDLAIFRFEGTDEVTNPRSSTDPANRGLAPETTAVRSAPEPDILRDEFLAGLERALTLRPGRGKRRNKGETERERWLWLQDRGRRLFRDGGTKSRSMLEALQSIPWSRVDEKAHSLGWLALRAYDVFTDTRLADAGLGKLRQDVTEAIRIAERGIDELLSSLARIDAEAFRSERAAMSRLRRDLISAERAFPVSGDQLASAFRFAERNGKGVRLRSALQAMAVRGLAEMRSRILLNRAGRIAETAGFERMNLASIGLDLVLPVRGGVFPTDTKLGEALRSSASFEGKLVQSIAAEADNEDRGPDPALVIGPDLCGWLADAIEGDIPTDETLLRAMASDAMRRFVTEHLEASAERIYRAVSSEARRLEEEGQLPAGIEPETLDRLTPWTPVETPSPPLPEYTRDKPWLGPGGKLTKDPLGVVEDAKAMADLITLEKPGPPLAIGLFGDWGAGKSTFMEILEQAIKENCERAAGSDALPFVENIAHIRFNAWHYAEANLWASLAAHIFRELLLQGEKGAGFDKRQVEALIGKLGVAEEAAKQAKQAVEAAEKAEDEAREALETKEKEIAEAEKALAAAEAPLGWAGLAIPEGAPDALAALGLGSASSDAERIVELADEARGLGGHLRYFASALLSGSRPGKWTVAGAVLFFLVFAGGGLLLPFLPFIQASVAEAAARLGALIGAVAAAATWLGPHVSNVNAKLGDLRAARDDLLEQRRDKKKTAREEAHAAALLLAERKVAARAAAAEHAAKQEALRHAQAIHAGERPGALFMSLIEARAGEDGYAKHLGLVSQLHDDFQLMSDLLLQRETRTKKTLAEKDRPPIDRIVLYIDDLDRCPDETVIKVLEAVHLLLGLPLFVAVVGVDSRWLEGALSRSYEKQLAAGEVRPEDYLEKIFQLPYRLKPMSLEEGGGFELLIESVMTDPEKIARDEAEAAVVSEVVAATPSGDVAEASDKTQEDTEDQPQDGEDQPESVAESGDSVQLDYVDIPPSEEETIEAQRKIVTLSQEEYDAIHTLGPLLSKSPRVAKRFMNLYRFEKARRMRAPKQSFMGDGEDPGDYLAVMIGLALETGLSRISNEIIGLASKITGYRGFGETVVRWLSLLRNGQQTPAQIASSIYRGKLPGQFSEMKDPELRGVLSTAFEDAVRAADVIKELGAPGEAALRRLDELKQTVRFDFDEAEPSDSEPNSDPGAAHHPGR